jgi:hypothetical protein
LNGHFLAVACDRDGVGDLLKGERDRLPVVAGPDADVGIDPRIEAGELRLDRVAPRRQLLKNVATPRFVAVTGSGAAAFVTCSMPGSVIGRRRQANRLTQPPACSMRIELFRRAR